MNLNQPPKYNYEIRYDETDINGFLSIFSLSNFLQESAGRHARSLGISVPQLQQKNLTWVLMKLQIEMQKYPMYGETITVETWPSWQKKLYAGRDYRIFNRGVEIGRATSSWLVLDLGSRRPVAVPGFIQDIYRHFPQTVFQQPFPRFPRNSGNGQSSPFHIRVSDLDINRHVNHIAYMEAVVQSLPPEIWENFKISEFLIEYRAETFYGDVLDCGFDHTHSTENSRHFLHTVVRQKDSQQVCRAGTVWKKI